MQYHDWLEDEAEIARRKLRMDNAHEHRFAPGVDEGFKSIWAGWCDSLSQTPPETKTRCYLDEGRFLDEGFKSTKTWCDLDEDCEQP